MKGIEAAGRFKGGKAKPFFKEARVDLSQPDAFGHIVNDRIERPVFDIVQSVKLACQEFVDGVDTMLQAEREGPRSL